LIVYEAAWQSLIWMSGDMLDLMGFLASAVKLRATTRNTSLRSVILHEGFYRTPQERSYTNEVQAFATIELFIKSLFLGQVQLVQMQEMFDTPFTAETRRSHPYKSFIVSRSCSDTTDADAVFDRTCRKGCYNNAIPYQVDLQEAVWAPPETVALLTTTRLLNTVVGRRQTVHQSSSVKRGWRKHWLAWVELIGA
jgi:hypothetical protein